MIHRNRLEYSVKKGHSILHTWVRSILDERHRLGGLKRNEANTDFDYAYLAKFFSGGLPRVESVSFYGGTDYSYYVIISPGVEAKDENGRPLLLKVIGFHTEQEANTLASLIRQVMGVSHVNPVDMKNRILEHILTDYG